MFVDILVPHDVQDQFLATHLKVLMVEGVGRLLFDVLQNFTNGHLVGVGNEAAVTLGLAAVVAGCPRAGNIFE